MNRFITRQSNGFANDTLGTLFHSQKFNFSTSKITGISVDWNHPLERDLKQKLSACYRWECRRKKKLSKVL